MRTGLFNSIVKIESLAAILLILTIALLIVYQTFTRELTVDAQAVNWSTQTSDDRGNGGSSFTEDLSSSDELSFSYTTQDNSKQSYAVFLISPPAEEMLLDLDWFTEITIQARAIGERKQQFLIYLRDRPEHLVPDGDPSTSKYNEAFFELTEQTQSILLPRECFVVPRWWIAEKAILPEDASPSFSNFEFIEIAVCIPNQANSGVVVIEKIGFRGPWIPPVKFYKLLLSIWSLLALPMSFKVFQNIRKKRAIRRVRRNQVAHQESGSKQDLQSTTCKSGTSDTIEVEIYDELSGLPTNFGLQGAIDAALRDVRNGETQANIILVDIDDMQRQNQINGMSAGNELIRQIASILEKNIPESHTVGRWRDDKFLIVCHGTDRDQSRELACNLRRRVDEGTTATCSFGVHQLNPINSFEEAFERATRCIQEAKFNGKNKVVLLNLRSTMIPLESSGSAMAGLSSSEHLI